MIRLEVVYNKISLVKPESDQVRSRRKKSTAKVGTDLLEKFSTVIVHDMIHPRLEVSFPLRWLSCRCLLRSILDE